MDLDTSDLSAFEDHSSDAFSPEKPASKAPSRRTAPAKKPLATSKSRPRNSDDDDVSGASVTPPRPKKPKNTPAPKKSGGDALSAMENNGCAITKADQGPAAAPSATKSKKTVDETYQRLTLLEHIVKRPDTYIGSVVRTEQEIWVLNQMTTEMEHRKINYVPGLYKIFDEILVNAADNKQGDDESHKMSYLKVTIDRTTGEITVANDGKGIPVVMHGTEGMYVPHMIFGHLLTGSNYDDNEKKTVGGRNGYGAKLCNVFSTEFTVEVQDSERGKRYKQTWTDNMSRAGKPKITSSKSANFIKVSFKPDFAKFNMPDGIDDDLECLLSRRVYDIAGTVRGIKVFLNDKHLKLSFKTYCEMFAKAIGQERSAEEGGSTVCTVVLEDNKAHPRWEVAFAVSDGSFQQVSFVNSIATTSGGTHVGYITDQITGHLLATLTKKKKGHTLKQNHIRNHIFIFINCLISNPAFTSQTKEQMTTKASQFGSRCVLTEGFLKKITASDVLKNIMDFAERKADKMMAKSDGKRSRISNAKLVDANLAGTRRGHECTLILTEGDSAKGLAISGRAILDPDRIGVFPLRGKMLNVRDASIEQITKNQEIQNIKQFLGLKHKQAYTNTKGLRYGHLMIMADQDYDGSHIKGLLINFLQVQFPSLLQIPGFFREFITPVVKAWQGSNPKKPQKLKTFFNIPQYEAWKETHKAERWTSKYFKGLGTSSNEDAQVYFTNLDDHLKEFEVMQPNEASLFDLVFSKKMADARKQWLSQFVPGTFLDHTTSSISYTNFVNKELILFSMADNVRSIPSVLDGLKPGQRKVLFACLKRNLVKDQKVIELAGYVSEQTAYQHGETSLQQTIIGLAQDFVGSNNVNLLEPSGNFGSRLAGGSDAASPRYIHTRLSPFARKVFSALDEPNLQHFFDDDKKIEPKIYVPIVPVVLLNGADGIGTGWSTSIPTYNPMDVIDNLKRRMGRLDTCEEAPFKPMQPWFRGWKGCCAPAGPDRFHFNGVITRDGNVPGEAVVTELPIRVWTDDFKARLEDIISGAKGPAFVKDYQEFNDHKHVRFVIQLEEKNIKDSSAGGLSDLFKLNKQVATSNLVAFDAHGQIRKYEKVEDILEEYYSIRMSMYSERKKHWLHVHHADYRKLKNQARFIRDIVDGKLVVAKKQKRVLIAELRDEDYEPFPKTKDGDKNSRPDDDEDLDASDGESGSGSERDYDYLLSMSIWSFTQERLDRLKEQIRKKKDEYDSLEALSEKDLWCRDLDAFTDEWKNQLLVDAEIQTNISHDDYVPEKKVKEPKAPKAPKAKVIGLQERSTAPTLTDAFGEKQAGLARRGGNDKNTNDLAGLSDDDFEALGKIEAHSPTRATRKHPDNAAEGTARSKGVTALNFKAWIESDDDSMGDSPLKADDDDYLVSGVNRLARPSPGKTNLQPKDTTDGLVSPSDPPLPKQLTASTTKAADHHQPPASATMMAKKRGRPLNSKSKNKNGKATKAVAAASRPASALSPAAKRYAAQRGMKRSGGDDSDDLNGGTQPKSGSPPSRPTTSGNRPRRAVASRTKPIMVIDDEDSDQNTDVWEPDESDSGM